MLPFTIQLRPGKPVFDQLVQAFHHALMSGQIRDGDAFPSVRSMSRELKISPTTAHKVVAHLKDRGFLVSQPGVGMLVTVSELPPLENRLRLLEPELRKLVADARDLSVLPEDLIARLESIWKEK